MTQSKDGVGRSQNGSPQKSAQPLHSPAGGGAAELPMLPHPSAIPSPPPVEREPDTDEMQDLLRKIASQIAEAEQRQGATLDGVHSRLAGLAEQTEAVKSEAPKDLQLNLNSIETRIAQIAETVEAAGRDVKSGHAPPTVAASSAGPTGPSTQPHVRGFGRGQTRGSNDVAAFDKLAPAPARQTAAPAVSPPRAAGLAALSPEAGGPWDRESAEALAKIFDDEIKGPEKGQRSSLRAPEAASLAVPNAAPAGPAVATRPTGSQPTAPVTSPSAPAGVTGRPTLDPTRQPRPEPPALASASMPMPPAKSAPSSSVGLSSDHAGTRPSTAAVASAGATSPPAAGRIPAPLASSSIAATAGGAAGTAAATVIAGVDRDWLTQRFAEIAAQVERSLREGRPERALSTLGQRFDKLETSLATVMSAVRTSTEQGPGPGAGQAALQALDSQISALKVQIDGTVQRLESLDALKADVASIAQRLGALDRLETAQTQVAAQLSGMRSDFGNLATAVPSLPGSPAPDQRIDALHLLMETQVHERREGESATVAVLQAIHGAIDQFTDRMSEFEVAVAAAVLGPNDPLPAGQSGHARQDRSPSAVFPSVNQPHQAASIADQKTAGVRLPLGQQPDDAGAFEEPRAGETVARPQPVPRGGGPFHAMRTGHAAAKAETASRMEVAIPKARRGLGNIRSAVDPGAHGPTHTDASAETRTSRRSETADAGGERNDLLEAARRAAEQPAPTGEPADFDVETIAARIPGQKRAKSKASRGGFFTFEQSGTRPIQLVAVVALLAAGAGMLYGTLTDRPQPLPVRLDKPKATVGKVGSARPKPDAESIVQRADAIGEPGAAAVSQVIEVDERRVVDMRAADSREAAISVLKPSADPETSPLYTSSSPAPAGRTGSGVTTGILIETGAPMPSIQDLRRYSEEQRMARISSQLGDKAVQVTERELASPASLTPDAVRPAVGPESAPSAAAVMSANAGGLPPALIGPMSLRVAAAKGDPSAEFEVASRFAQGKGVPKDFVKAAEWYQRAASRGSAPAQYRLGGLYERGIGVAVDPARARAWYRRAAELGNVKAMHNLAVMHTQRHGGEPDYASASQWFTKAAHHGLSDSQFNLAILHENGMGVARNPLEAYKWYALAAERGDSEAVKRRNAIAGKLSPADVERNRLAVAKWRPHATDPAANDPMMAGQAWRNRPSEDQMGGQGDGPTAPAANRAAARPVTTSGASPRQRPVQQEAEIIDLSSAAIDAQMKIDNAAAAKTAGAAQAETAAGPSAETSGEQQAIMNRKRKVTKVQSSADVEKMLTQFGYNPAALKKARPGGTSEEPSAASAREE